jgi:hypothetical protein
LPPTEASKEGKLWLLKQAAYGILDGGRMFVVSKALFLKCLVKIVVHWHVMLLIVYVQ